MDEKIIKEQEAQPAPTANVPVTVSLMALPGYLRNNDLEIVEYIEGGTIVVRPVEVE